jgi:hypothetical protein
MSSADEVIPAEQDWPLSNPWPWMIAGLALLGTALLWVQLLGDKLTPVRVGLVFLGVVGAGAAVAIRAKSEKVLGAAALAAFTGAWALYLPNQESSWNSIRLVLAVTAVVAVLAAFLVAIPRVWRRVAVSVLVVVHFCGILTAVTAAPPAPWLANVLWVYFYRPYLQFMYLNNAYHFYAPNPGDSYEIRFRVEYTTDADPGFVHWTWRTVPKLDPEGWPEYTLALQYQRRIALANLLAQSTTGGGPTAEAVYRREKENMERYEDQRPIIPRNPVDTHIGQYAAPTKAGLHVLSSFVRHVAYEFRHSHPGARIQNIKVYRIEHKFLSAPEMESGKQPQDPNTYFPYFWGNYDPEGVLKSEQDPYLYWQLPIMEIKPKHPIFFLPNDYLIAHLPAGKFPGGVKPRPDAPEEDHFSYAAYNACRVMVGEKPKVLNFMLFHAGDPKWVRYPGEDDWSEPRGSDREFHRRLD